MNDEIAGCYVHLPFCDRICPYCDFAVLEYEKIKAARYLRALATEIGCAPLPVRPVRTIFLGGGTPSALESEQIGALLAALFEKFGVAPGTIECTLEANPSRNIQDLAVWRAAGITRLSIGVQSLSDPELHRLGRTHSAAEAIEFIRAARAAGFTNVSLDLIAGVPGQTLKTFSQTIAGAVDLEPDHVSVYGMTIEPGTPYATWRARHPEAFPSDDEVADSLAAAHDALVGAGYRHYELSNFARPGFECDHNIGYWRQRECAAFGLSAAGYESGTRYRNARDFAAYCAAIESGVSARIDAEHLDFASRIGEAAMLALRTADGIERDDFRRRFLVDPATIFENAIKKCSAAGLLEVDVRGARLTDRGRLLANDVCAEFLAPAL